MSACDSQDRGLASDETADIKIIDVLAQQLGVAGTSEVLRDHLGNWVDIDTTNDTLVAQFVGQIIDENYGSLSDLTSWDDKSSSLHDVLKESLGLDEALDPFKIVVLELFNQIFLLSESNKIAVQKTDTLDVLILHLTMKVVNFDTPLVRQIRRNCVNLLEFGCDSHLLMKLYLNALEDESCFWSGLLFEVMNMYPGFVDYLVMRGGANIRVPNISLSVQGGFTVQTWVQFNNEIDSEVSMIKMKGKETSMKFYIRDCRLFVDTAHILSSSNHTDINTTPFTFIFDTNRFYHIVLVSSSGYMSLYVDGEFVEKAKMDRSSSILHKLHTTHHSYDLTIGDDTAYTSNELLLKNFLILSYAQSPEWIILSYNLGAEYDYVYENNGLNYLNYETFNKMELRLEEEFQGRKDGSVGLGKLTVDRNSIIVNIIAKQYPIDKRSAILLHRCSSIYKTFYTIGGVALILRLIESSGDKNSLLLSMKLLFKLLGNFRNIKEMESINGYDILASILKAKYLLVDNDILDVILSFVGYDFNNPMDSRIINPLAYRALIVDFELWKKSNGDTFKFLLFQFTIFGQDSRYSMFNIKKLIKMKIIKRFIQALKYGSFEERILPIVYDSLLILVKSNSSVEVLRSLSLYVVYGMKGGKVFSEETALQQVKRAQVQKKCAQCVLEVLTATICESTSVKLYKKFTKAITIRWVLLVLGETENAALIKTGLRLFGRMLAILGKSSYTMFFGSNGGEILTHLLRKWWFDDEIVVSLYSLSFSGLYLTTSPGIDLSLFASKRIASSTRGDNETQLTMPGFQLVLNNVVEYSLVELRTKSQEDDFEAVLNGIHLVSGFISSVKSGVECNMKSIQNLYFSKEWLSAGFRILGRVKLAMSDVIEFSDSYNNFRKLLANMFISKLFGKEFNSIYDHLDEISNQLLMFSVTPLIFEHISQFIGVSEFNQSQSKDSDFFQNMTRLLLQYGEFMRFVRVDPTDLNTYIACLLSIIEKTDNDGRLSLFRGYKKSLKRCLGGVLVDAYYDCVKRREQQTIQVELKRLLYNQSVLFSNDVLESQKLNELVVLMFKTIIDGEEQISEQQAKEASASIELCMNCLRTVYLHRGGGNGLLFSGLFELLGSMDNIEGVKLIREDVQLKDVVHSNWVEISRRVQVEYHNGGGTSFDFDRLIKSNLNQSWTASATVSSSTLNSFGKDYDKLVKLIINGELTKYSRHIQDNQDNAQFYVSAYNRIKTETSRLLLNEADKDKKKQKYIVDYIEGIDRMRKRMVPEEYLTESERLSYNVEIPLQATETITDQLAIQEGFTEVSEFPDSVDVNDHESFEVTDKNRKVLRSLFVGDRIVDIWNISQINGLTATESLMILGVSHLYLIENYFHCNNGEVVDIDEVDLKLRDPYLQLIGGRYTNETKQHRIKTWELEKFASMSKRQFLLRDVALEMFFNDGASVLITCLSGKGRDGVYNKLQGVVGGRGGIDSDLSEVFKLAGTIGGNGNSNGVAGTASSFANKLVNVFSGNGPIASNVIGSSSGVESFRATRKWQTGKLSNFYYLMLINTLAGRTFNDLTQYPVFPWIIADYTSEELDLNDPKTYRDLSKPMGGQTESRASQFRERYEALESLQDPNDMDDTAAPPFHYGTHYSSAMVVTSFLIRLEPYVQSYLVLQGGKFDHADRLFYSIAKAWNSASKDNTTDVRELIPEFFFLPEFLVNSNGFEFGKLQDTRSSQQDEAVQEGRTVNDVTLPPWAKGDPKIFIQKNREALESDYVSEHLHEWIDLVFGFKQNGAEAVRNLNVFHHLSYNGAINLDKIDDDVERRAMTGIINNFGQTPLQLFTRPHPRKRIEERIEGDKVNVFGLDPSPSLLIDKSAIDRSGEAGIGRLQFSNKGWTALPNLVCNEDGLHIKLGNDRGTLIVNNRVLENVHDREITALVQLGGKSFITGSSDGIINIWKYPTRPTSIASLSLSPSPGSNINGIGSQNSFLSYRNSIGGANDLELELQSILRGHLNKIKSILVSKPFNLAASLDVGGDVIVWDLARKTFVRKLDSKGDLAGISNDSGVIGVVKWMTSDTRNPMTLVNLFTINGELIVSQEIPGKVSCFSFGSISGSSVDDGNVRHHDYWPNEIIGFAMGESVILYQLIISKNGKWVLQKVNHFGNKEEVDEENELFDYEENELVKHAERPVVGRITCIELRLVSEYSMEEKKLTRQLEIVVGDEVGRVFIWK